MLAADGSADASAPLLPSTHDVIRENIRLQTQIVRGMFVIIAVNVLYFWYMVLKYGVAKWSDGYITYMLI